MQPHGLLLSFHHSHSSCGSSCGSSTTGTPPCFGLAWPAPFIPGDTPEVELEAPVEPGKTVGAVVEVADVLDVLEVDDDKSATTFVTIGSIADVEEVEEDGEPKVEATFDADETTALGSTTAEDDATAAEDDPSLTGFTCWDPPQFLPVGLPQPFPPATGHHSGSGSPGAQSGMGGEVSSSYCGL